LNQQAAFSRKLQRFGDVTGDIRNRKTDPGTPD
jgi:hypothetical protein